MYPEHDHSFALLKPNYRRCHVHFAVALLLAATVASGCGDNSPGVTVSAGSPTQRAEGSTVSSYAAPVSTAASSMESSTRSRALSQNVAAETKAMANATALVTASKDVSRKIIYKATLSLVVEELAQAQKKLTQLVKERKGYIAETDISGASGAPRRGTWTVRVPVAQYEAFVSAASALGELQSAQSDSDDVSEEYYDLEARIKNKKVEETRLVQHLLKSTGKLREILLVEKEISRVRGEIEQMQGRVRVLANLTSLTTVTITINEIKDYVPPKPPAFSTEIGRTFSRSLGDLGTLGKKIVLSGVATTPWLLLFGFIALPLWRITRRRWQRFNVATPSVHDG